MSSLISAIFGGGEKAPAPAPMAPPPDPTVAQKAIEDANAETRRKAKAASGRRSTNPMGGAGDTSVATVQKTTLGA